MALEQNREVFAVPGHPLDPRAIGTNDLIKAGAVLVASAADVIDVIAPSLIVRPGLSEAYQAAAPDSPADALTITDLPPQERKLILEALSVAPVAVDIIVRQTGLTSRQVAIALLELDLAGRIERHGQHSVSLRQNTEMLV
jgi:DNA processing protein